LFAGTQLSEGTQRLPYLELGQHRVKVIKTEFKQYTRSLVVELEYVSSVQRADLVGSRCSVIFATGGTTEQAQRRSEDWTRFAIQAAGYDNLAMMVAAGQNPIALGGLCCMPEGTHPQAQPFNGRILDVTCIDSGARTKPSKKDPEGGKMITNKIYQRVK
jgi:hypothetical protein